MVGKQKYSDDEIHKEALKYNTRSEFQKNSKYYHIAFTRKILDKVCSHMETNMKFWDHNSVKEETLKYKTLKEFSLNSPSAYQYVIRNNIKENICKHFPKQFRWTLDKCLAESKKYNYRSDFQKGSNGAYKWAHKNKKIDEVCKHMKVHKYTPRGRFTYEGRKTILYYIKVNDFYKIGIVIHEQYSNPEDSILKRRYGSDIKNGLNIEIIDYIIFNEGTKAYDIEEYIKEEHYEKQYKGEQMLKGGNSEIFSEDIYKDIKDKFC